MPSLASSQGVAIARIEDVRALQDGGACFATKSAPGDAQSFTRLRNGRIDRPWPRDSVVFRNDRLVVTTRNDVRVRVDSAIGVGTLYLAPDLGRCPGSEVGRHIAGNKPATGNGSYELRQDTVGRGTMARDRVVLSVKNGAAIMQWRTGQLSVRAFDEQINDLGSVFTVIVDSAGNKGIVAVQEGLVTLRSGTIRASAGQAYTFGPGQPLRPVIVRSAGLEEIKFHSDEAWKSSGLRPALASIPRPPLPSLPWKRIIVGTAGLSAAGYAALKLMESTKAPPPVPPVRAIVVVTIPL